MIAIRHQKSQPSRKPPDDIERSRSYEGHPSPPPPPVLGTDSATVISSVRESSPLVALFTRLFT